MTTLVARPPNQTIAFRADWACHCGRGRAVIAKNVRTDLPFDVTDRPAGPCPDCGRGATYSITSKPGKYLIHVERG